MISVHVCAHPWTKQAVAGVADGGALSGTMSNTSCARIGAATVVVDRSVCRKHVRVGRRNSTIAISVDRRCGVRACCD